MSKQIEIEGLKDFEKTLRDIDKRNRIGMDKLLAAAAFEHQKISVENISTGGRSGRVYKKKGGVVHQASAPGEYPKTDNADLVTNITVNKEGPLRYTSGSRKGAPHGFYLEMKAPHKGGRKWASRAFNEMVGKFDREGLFR